MIDMTERIGPYVGINKDKSRTYENGRAIRFAIYGMYCAQGLYGSEHNGIVIFDHDKGLVVCDKINCAGSGYFGPTVSQLCAFETLTTCSWDLLVEFVAGHPQTREGLEE